MVEDTISTGQENGDHIPEELRQYFKSGELIKYTPPEKHLHRTVPQNIHGELARELGVLADYLSLPMIEDIWGNTQNAARAAFHRTLSPRAQEVFRRNRILTGSVTRALLVIGAIENLMPDLQVPKYTASVTAKRMRFITNFRNIPRPDPDNANRKKLLAQLDKFVVRVFDAVVKASNTSQTS